MTVSVSVRIFCRTCFTCTFCLVVIKEVLAFTMMNAVEEQYVNLFITYK